MRKAVIILMLIMCTALFVQAAEKPEFSKEASVEPELVQKGESKTWCPVCGMNLKMYWKTSHAVYLKDGSARQYCSMRCLAVDFDNIKEAIDKIVVTDAVSEKLIDAYKAYYVIGSSVPGTMTAAGKLAFADDKDANDFQAVYGGELADFQRSFTLANESLENDIAMTNAKRAKMMYPVGEKVFTKMCSQDVDPAGYAKISDLKAALKGGLCKPLKEKELQAAALYLWDVRRVRTSQDAVHVHDDEKCPVCGMFVHKYPRWAAQLFYKDNADMKHFSFDGVKDMMKFYFAPAKWGDYKMTKFESVLVTDYYTQKGLDGRKAFYVTGSDVIGPMGAELIPFGDRASAETFARDHSGRGIFPFNELTPEIVNGLDVSH